MVELSVLAAATRRFLFGSRTVTSCIIATYKAKTSRDGWHPTISTGHCGFTAAAEVVDKLRAVEGGRWHESEDALSDILGLRRYEQDRH
jgi:hypothetical protein